HAVYFVHVIGPTRHNNEPNPDWMFSSRQPTRKFMDRFGIHPGKPFMQVWFYRFQSEHDKIDRRQIMVGQARSQVTVRFERGVNSTFVYCRKQSGKKAILD